MFAKALPLLAVLLLASAPDEGQWLPTQIRNMDWAKLRARGLELTPDQLWHPEEGGLLNAAVQINQPGRGHCTAAFVSESGLIITNHHCGDDAIGQLSTLKKNYQREGFLARSHVQELQTNMVVHVVRGIVDVTERIHAAQQRAGNAIERYDLTQVEINKLIEEGERDPESGQKDPMTTCHVASFFEGREYHLYYRTQINDVRLVYAPPKSTADYGGNIDNWEWPRHAGDFVLLRAYVAPDGTPLPYSADNVPYSPHHHLKMSTEGVSKNDLVMIIGYPGRTLRYLSSVAVQEQAGFQFPKRRDILLQVIAVLQEAAENDPEKQIKLSAAISSFANIEKNHLGMIKGLARNAVVDRKIREEEAFEAWAKNRDRGEFVDVLYDLKNLDHQAKTTQEKDLLLGLLLSQRVLEQIPLLATTCELVRAAVDSEEGEEIDYPAELLARIGSEDAIGDLDTIQKPLLQVLLEEARNLPENQLCQGTEVLGDSDVAASEMVEALLAGSDMLSPEARLSLLRAGHKAVEASTDPLVVLAHGLVHEEEQLAVRSRARAGQRMVVGPRWIEAQQAWRGKSFYPDANSTIRISIAEVKGYSPSDAVEYGPFTTVAGMMEKHTGVEPFKMTDSLRQAAERRWVSQFHSQELGDVPVCFLSDGDTTNGNSGSPVINGKGELVGLNFDRVFENVAGDFGWDPERSRNISLDMRFVLWHLESVMPAPHLLRELGAL